MCCAETEIVMSAVICSILLAVAVFMDIRKRIIPNILTFPAAGCGLMFHGICTGWCPGSFFAFKGMATGIALLIIPFVLGGTGGGDVKLLGAMGAWLGSSIVIEVFVYGAIAGIVFALFLIFIRKKKISIMSVWDDILYFSLTGKKVASSKNKNGFPYSLPVAIGFCCYLLKEWL